MSTTAIAEIIIHPSEAVEVASRSSSRATALLLEAQSLVISDQLSYQGAADLRNGINAEEKAAEAARDALVRPLNQHVKWINEKLFKPASAVRTEALIVLRRKLVAYDDEQRLVRENEERAAREKLRKEEERLAALAAKAEARGDEAKAEAFRTRAEVAAVAPVIVPEVPKANGISYRTTYRAEVTDLKALCAAVVAGTVPAAAIVADQKFLDGAARSMKGAVQWPGIRWISERTVAGK